MKEKWKILREHPSYQISNIGRIRNIRTNYVLKNSLNCGYFRVTLAGKQIRIHQLVASEFLPKIIGKNFINHINGIKTDNRIENLEWVTFKENIQHAYRIGLIDRRGMSHNQVKLDNAGVLAIRDAYKYFGRGSQIAIAKYFNITKENISAICTGRTWQSLKSI